MFLTGSTTPYNAGEIRNKKLFRVTVVTLDGFICTLYQSFFLLINNYRIHTFYPWNYPIGKT